MTAFNSPYGNRAVGMGNTTGTGNVQLIAAPTNNLRIRIRTIVIYNSDATLTTGVYMKSNTTIIFGPIPAPAKGGSIMVNLADPIECNFNEALNFAAIDAVNQLYVSVLGTMVVQ